MNKKNLFFLVVISVSIFLNALIAFFIFSLTSQDNFDKAPLILQPGVSDSEKNAILQDIESFEKLSVQEQKLLMKILIKQYVMDRYTFIPDQNYFNAKTGKWIQKEDKTSSLVSYKYNVNHNASVNYRTGRYNQVWYEYIDEKNGEIKNFEEMLKFNATQKVIVKEIYEDGEFWVAKIRLYRKKLGEQPIYEDKTIRLQARIYGISVQEGVEEKPQYYYQFEVYFLKT